MKMKQVTVGNVTFGPYEQPAIIAGPCQIEGLDHTLRHAEAIVKAAQKAGLSVIYKSSFDKATEPLRMRREVWVLMKAFPS